MKIEYCQLLVKSQIVLLDKTDLSFFNQYSWRIVNGYVARSKRIGQKVTTIHLHTDLMKPEKDFETDHINRNKLDNRRSNLRVVTHSQNCQNRRKSSRNTSGYIGIRKKKGRTKWEVLVTVAGKHFYVGYYSNLQEAIKARDNKTKELHGKFAQLNGVT